MDKKSKKHQINKYLFYSKRYGATLPVYARSEKKAMEIVDIANLYNDSDWTRYSDKSKFKTKNEEYEIVMNEMEKRKKLFVDTRA